MSAVDHTAPRPPSSVINRCAATLGLHGSAHGANTAGLRLPDGSEYGDKVAESMAELSESMRVARLRWEAGKVTTR